MVKKKLPPTPLTPEQAVAYMKRKKELAATRLLRVRQNRQYKTFIKKAEKGKFWSFIGMIFYFATGQWLLALIFTGDHEQHKRNIELARLTRHKK